MARAAGVGGLTPCGSSGMQAISLARSRDAAQGGSAVAAGPVGEGMFGLYGVAGIYTVLVAILCVRRGQMGSWLWVIVFFGPIGATIYLVSEFEHIARPRSANVPRPSTAGLRRAQVDAERIGTAAAWTECASLHAARGQWDVTAEAARRALALEPENLEATYELGRAALARRQWGEARAALERVVARQPDHASGETLFALARACKGGGDLAAARQRLEVLAERSSRADFLYELGRLQEQMGDRPAARSSYRRIVDEFVFTPAFMRGRVRLWVWRAKWRLLQLGSG